MRLKLKVSLGLPQKALIHLHLSGEYSSVALRVVGVYQKTVFSMEILIKLFFSPFIPKSKIADHTNVGLQFSVNGQMKQSGTTADMINGVPELISFVSGIMRLEVRSYICIPIPLHLRLRDY